jgi:hypothetical protein
MPLLDIGMPLTLLAVMVVALFLNERTERKLTATLEEREFRTRDVVLLVAMVVVAVSVVAYISILDPGQIFQNIILLFFLFSYSLLLFIFSYLFSGMKRRMAQLFSLGFGVASLVAGTVSLMAPFVDGLAFYRALAFYCLAIFAFSSIIIDAKKAAAQERWYVAVQPPALFVLLFVFFNVVYGGGTLVWYPVLLDVFALTFAVLIILYLGSLFTWKTVLIFAILLTIVDIILVIGTGTMVDAAQQFTGLGLPVLVYIPKIPLIPIPTGSPSIGFFGYIPSGLGLGDFFFAGILALQTLKKFDKKTALLSIVAMSISFAIWLAFINEITTALEPLIGRELLGFPGTLMIITGWIPIVAWKLYSERKQKTQDREMDQKIGNDVLPEQGA